MNKLFRLIALLCMICSGIAHAGSYAFRGVPFNFDNPSAAATTVTWAGLCTRYAGGDDDYAVVNFPGGFTFPFAGTTYSQVRIMSNGMISFGADAGFHRDYLSQALPITAAGTPGAPSTGVAGSCASAIPTNLLMVYWLDINTQPNITLAPVQYELLGTAPNRRFVITWKNVALYNNNSTRYTFQVALNEDGTFKYQYTVGNSTGTGATVGVQVSSTDSTQYAYDQAFIDPNNGTAILWYPLTQAPAKQAEYWMEEATWTGTAGEVADISGNSRNGVRVGTVTTVLPPSPYNYCRAANVPSNLSTTTIDAISIPMSPQSLGTAGGLMFWYRGVGAWNDGTARMLVDATKTSGYPFFLSKTNSGQLQLTMTDSSGTTLQALTTTKYNFAANTWHHIGASWVMQTGTNQTVLQIFVDGQLAAFERMTGNGLWPLSTNAYQNFYVGDNRTSGVTPKGGSGNSANGMIDELSIYDFDISQAQANTGYTTPARASCSTLNHFQISHSGIGSTCQPENITISAHDTAHNPVVLTGTSINLTTSTAHGDWSVVTGNNAITSAGNGVGSYVFSNESSIVIGLRNTFAETVNINVNSGGITENTNGFAGHDPDLVFSNDVFKFVTSSQVEANPITGKRSGKDSNVSPEGQTLYLQAIKTDSSNFSCSAAFPNSTTPVNIDMAFQCLNPSTCIAGQNASMTNSANTTTGNIALVAATPALPATYTTVPLVFGANSMAQLKFNYPDAGQMKLQARYEFKLGNGTGSGRFMVGASQPFIVAPNAFGFSAINQAAAPNLPNPAATSATGTKFVKASESFLATVTALNFAGVATPNFGKEATPERVSLTSSLVLPATGASGVLATTAATAINAGATTATLNWSEVGIINVLANLTSASYIGSGLTVTGSSGNVGRFYPDHFVTTVTQGCNPGAFSYSAQPFKVVVTALNGNAIPATTVNYAGSTSFAKDVTLSDATASAIGALSNTAILASAFTSGIATTLTPSFTFTNQAGTRQNPVTTIGLRAIDADLVSSLGFTEGQTQVRAGRVQILNAHGSELVNLLMPMEAQYWNGNSWVRNTADVCTGDTTIANNAVSIAFTNSATLACVLDTGNPGRSGAGCTAAAPTTRQFIMGGIAGFTGNFNLGVKVQTTGTSGYTTVTGTVPTWLRFNWGTGVTNPTGRATFGIYKGGPVIFTRENY